MHLSHVVVEDPPLDAMEQQHVAGMLLDLASRLRRKGGSSSGSHTSSSTASGQPALPMLLPGGDGAGAAAGSLAASSAGEAGAWRDAGEGGSSYSTSGGGSSGSSSSGTAKATGVAHGGVRYAASVAVGGLALLTAGELTSAVCALSRMGYYDPPLLREAAEAAREAAEGGWAGSRQAAGLLWAFSR